MKNRFYVGLTVFFLLFGLAGTLEAATIATSEILRDAARVYLQGDFATAFSLWRPLADQGEPMAQTNLGIMYAKGENVKQDYVRAYMWLSLASSFGSEEAARYLGIISRHMTAEQVSEAERQISNWRRR